MAHTLTYTVENASLVTMQRQVPYEGQTATISFDRADIECVPADADNKTLSLILPAEALADFPEGATVTVTLGVTPPAPAA